MAPKEIRSRMNVLIPCLFSIFSILCKIIYMYLMYVVFVFETTTYADYVFLPELVSLGFLTGAYAAELYYLILYENRIYSSVTRIGKYRYKTLKGQKEWAFIACCLLLVASYLVMFIYAISFNRKDTSQHHH